MKSFLLAVASLLYVSNGVNAYCQDYYNCLGHMCQQRINDHCGVDGNSQAFFDCVAHQHSSYCPNVLCHPYKFACVGDGW